MESNKREIIYAFMAIILCIIFIIAPVCITQFNFIISHLDYIAMFFLLLGYIRMGTFKVDGWVWTGLGSVLLVIFGIFIVPAAFGVAIGNAIFIILTIRGFIKWRKSGQISNKN